MAIYVGSDASSSGNNWLATNISTTAGITNDLLVDVPGIASVTSQPDVGGVQRGNYCTLSVVDFDTAAPTGGGLILTNGFSRGTMAIPSTGKWYWEVYFSAVSNAGLGLSPSTSRVSDANGSGGFWGYIYTGNKYEAGSASGYGSTFTAGDTIAVAVDADAGTVTYYKNNVSQGIAHRLDFKNIQWLPTCRPITSSTGYINFGQRAYTYTPPAGYKSLCTTNLPNPVIKLPSDHFDVKTYTGNGTQLMVGVNPKQLQTASINKSLRFKSNLKTYLTRTPSSASNRQTWTWSGWVKRGLSNTRMTLMGGYTGTTNGSLRTEVIILDGGAFQMYTDQIQTATDFSVVTNQIFKDTSSWYHFVAVLDTTQSSSVNRVKLYVNGVQISSFSSASYPSQNYQSGINYNNIQYINRYYDTSGGNYYGDGYLADVNFIDGQALTPSSFGQFDANNNWAPKTYTGTYGTNGYKLDFNDTRSPTTAAYDVSGNSNHWTPLIETALASAGWNTAPTAANAPNVLYYGTPGTYTWTAPAGVTSVTYLVVGGGGGGGDGVPTRTTGAGGGAGGYLTGTLSVTPSTSYTVTVGAGGLPGTSPTNGGNSVFASITALGGGYGAYGGNNGATGGTGGSGGGTSGPYSGGTTNGGLGTAGQGNNGGVASQFSCSGGGGAGQVGGNSSPGAYGGNGLANTITGVSVYYAGGGGGSIGGLGGGGRQADNPSSGTAARPGTDGLGGGGGGGSNPTTAAARGGSGVVILSYTNAGSYVGAGVGSSINNDSSMDVPANSVDSLGNSIGNFAIWSTSNQTASYNTTATISEGGLLATGGAINNSWNAIGSLTIPTTGKWYWEVECSPTAYGNGYTGITGKNISKNTGWRIGTGVLLNDGTTAYTYTSYNTTSANRVGIAYDADAGKMWFTDISGAWLNSKTPGVDTTGLVSGIIKDDYVPFWSYNSGAEINLYVRANFGQSPFAYTQPTGFKSLNTKNLNDVGVSNLPDNYGNYVNSPDLVWIKSRSGAYDHQLADTIRGPRLGLKANSQAVQSAEANGVQTFMPNGFIVNSAQDFNNSGSTYVTWNWNRGKIPGFDIVNYGGNITNYLPLTIPHNLGAPPAFMMVKAMTDSTAGNRNWNCYHKGLGPGYTTYISLVSSAANTDIWANIVPDSKNFYIGGAANAQEINYTGGSYIAYLWAEVPGFSRMGLYTGNGGTSNFIYCGFRPRFVMVKATGTANSTNNSTEWTIWDTARNILNPTLQELYPNRAFAEATDGSGIDILSNGFNLKRNSEYANWSGTNYIFVAFAEAPFKYANAR
jgi:hypothetical protein